MERVMTQNIQRVLFLKSQFLVMTSRKRSETGGNIMVVDHF